MNTENQKLRGAHNKLVELRRKYVTAQLKAGAERRLLTNLPCDRVISAAAELLNPRQITKGKSLRKRDFAFAMVKEHVDLTEQQP